MGIDKIPTVWLSITYRCNNKCSWCYAKNETQKNIDLSDKNEKLFLDFLSELNVRKIILIGGEPTLYKNIFKLINEANTKKSRGEVPQDMSVLDYYRKYKSPNALKN